MSAPYRERAPEAQDQIQITHDYVAKVRGKAQRVGVASVALAIGYFAVALFFRMSIPNRRPDAALIITLFVVVFGTVIFIPVIRSRIRAHNAMIDMLETGDLPEPSSSRWVHSPRARRRKLSHKPR